MRNALQSDSVITRNLPRHIVGRAVVVGLLALVVACGGKRPVLPQNSQDVDRFLMDHATEAMEQKDWVKAREYYRQLVDNYSQSPLRPDAKLGLADSYLGENTPASLVLAANEYREFLTFYPTSTRADYAQYKLAMTHFAQMRAPERDQSETKAALREFDAFFDRFPNSPLTPDVRRDWRIARDRMSEAAFTIGYYYYRRNWFPGAVPRFREILKEDPGYSHRDDVYFYLAEIYARSDKKAEAIPYYERLLAEFTASDHLEEARKRLGELKPAP